MTSWLGQYCLNVADLDASVAFYTGAGARLHQPHRDPPGVRGHRREPGGRLEAAARPAEGARPTFDLGTAFWKLYVNTHDIAATYGPCAEGRRHRESEPERMERWPVTVGFVRDLDGYLVEFVERHPGPTMRRGGPWLGQYCLNVTDIEATIAFYELLGPHVHEPDRDPPRPRGDRRAARRRREAAARPAGRPGRPDPHGLDVEALREHRRLRRLVPAPPPGTPDRRAHAASTGGR